MEITIKKNSRFYMNCRKQRKRKAKVCEDCPFRELIEKLEIQDKIQ